jgi:thiamine pyrophosphate-dependent acetolactate synthase large subunit-like protein
VPAALEAVVRAHRIAMTPPRGPTYVCLDAGLQEQVVDNPVELPAIERFRPGSSGVPSEADVAAVAAALAKARRPVILMGRVSTDPEDWTRRVRLAERLNAVVVTDLKTGASFPTAHPSHPYSPGLFLDEASYPAIRDADIIIGLDWIDLGGSLRQACLGRWPDATVVNCSLDEYSHNGWSMDYQALPPADIAILAPPDALVARLLDAVKPSGPVGSVRPPPAAVAVAADEPPPKGFINIQTLARTVVEVLAAHNPSYLRLPIGWPGECCRFAHPLDYIGFDGGGGIGSGPGMAVGAALALRDGDRFPVAILGDGDYLMGLTALWTGVSHGIPVLVVVANNQSFFNDELHQERVARRRDRPIENRSIGMRMSDPPMNMATLAEGQGAVGLGPVGTEADLRSALARGVEAVKGGAICVIDVRVAPEYARATSSSVLRELPPTD